MILDTIFKIIAIMGMTALMGTATYTLIASEIRQRRLDKEYEDSMKRLYEELEQECVRVDDVETIDETAGYEEEQEHE